MELGASAPPFFFLEARAPVRAGLGPCTSTRMLRTAYRDAAPPSPPPTKETVLLVTVDAMINAFLVFNGQGQPRMTKFYTQLVGRPNPTSALPIVHGSLCMVPRLPGLALTPPPSSGHKHSTASDLGNIRPCIQQARRVLQLPAASSTARRLGNVALVGRRPAERCTFARHIPPLRDPVLHRHIDGHRVAAGSHRLDTGLR